MVITEGSTGGGDVSRQFTAEGVSICRTVAPKAHQFGKGELATVGHVGRSDAISEPKKGRLLTRADADFSNRVGRIRVILG